MQRLVDAATALRLDHHGRVFRRAESDAMAWADEFGVACDVSMLSAEKDVLRYLPVPVTIRHEDARIDELLRVVAAGVQQAPL